MSFFEKLFGSFSDKELKRINPLKDKVLALEPESTGRQKKIHQI